MYTDIKCMIKRGNDKLKNSAYNKRKNLASNLMWSLDR